MVLTTTLIYPVILAGGAGTRLWPKSREKYPKQFINLIDGKSLFQETCLRFSNRSVFASPTIITHEEHRFLVREQLLSLGISDAHIITEPLAKNTLAACLTGALFLKQQFGDVPILFAPSDHIISEEEHLFSSIHEALPYVLGGSICIFGITPLTPHTGYGYITQGKKLYGRIINPTLFVEKPTKEHAERLISQGALWNSGMYFSTAESLQKEAALYMQKSYTLLSNFFSEKLVAQEEFFMIPHDTYVQLDSVSIDKGITEHTKKIILAITPIVWSDLGSWSSLYDHFEKTEDGNVLRGDVVALSTKNSYIESTSRLVSVIGLENIGVVETSDAVLVFPLQQSESIKKIIESLTRSNRDEISTHTKI